MAANRKLPFGYEMVSGVIVIYAAEADTVRWIYRQYIAGDSYERLTQELQAKPIPYLSGKPWNKNMVARILADERYTGTEKFPQVLDPELYREARKTVPSRAPVRKKSENAEVIQTLAVCGVCGAKVFRAPNQHGKERWYCPGCKGISTKATDRRLEQDTAGLLKWLSRSQGRIVQEMEPDRAVPESIFEQETAFRELLSAPGFDEKLARQMVFDLAAARFAALSGQHYETMRIRYLLEQSTVDTKVPTLLRQIASAVLIHPDGSVSLKLKNGQIINGSDKNHETESEKHTGKSG